MSNLRDSNKYREYDEEDIRALKKIKVLRNLDISISRIKDIGEFYYTITLKNMHL